MIVDAHLKKEIKLIERKISFYLRLAKSVLSLGKKMSELVGFHQDLIQSGFVWRCLQFGFFGFLRDLVKAFEPKERKNS